MDHAWAMAEIEPFKYVALEATGGYLVWEEDIDTTEEKNNLYYGNRACFNTPSEFKTFIKLREDFVKTCEKADEMINDWNDNYVGKTLTSEASEYKGKMEQKTEECYSYLYQLDGLLN